MRASGNDLVLSLDIDSQMAAEAGLEGRRGSVVAIDPNNGEIIVFASAPGFDPNSCIKGSVTQATPDQQSAKADDDAGDGGDDTGDESGAALATTATTISLTAAAALLPLV